MSGLPPVLIVKAIHLPSRDQSVSTSTNLSTENATSSLALEPSGFIVKMALLYESFGPANAILWESGVQRGAHEAHVRKLVPKGSRRPNKVTPVPSAFITETRENSRSAQRTNAIWVPSGDQLGSMSSF